MLEDLNGNPMSIKFKVEENFIDTSIVNGIAAKIAGSNWNSYNGIQQQQVINGIKNVFEMLPQYSQLTINDLYNNNTIDLSCFPYSIFAQLDYFKSVSIKFPVICDDNNKQYIVHDIPVINNFRSYLYENYYDKKEMLSSSNNGELNIIINSAGKENTHAATIKLTGGMLLAKDGDVYESYVGSNSTLLYNIITDKYYFVNELEKDGLYLNFAPTNLNIDTSVTYTFDTALNPALTFNNITFINDKDNVNKINLVLAGSSGTQVSGWSLSQDSTSSIDANTAIDSLLQKLGKHLELDMSLGVEGNQFLQAVKDNLIAYDKLPTDAQKKLLSIYADGQAKNTNLFDVSEFPKSFFEQIGAKVPMVTAILGGGNYEHYMNKLSHTNSDGKQELLAVPVIGNKDCYPFLSNSIEFQSAVTLYYNDFSTKVVLGANAAYFRDIGSGISGLYIKVDDNDHVPDDLYLKAEISNSQELYGGQYSAVITRGNQIDNNSTFVTIKDFNIREGAYYGGLEATPPMICGTDIININITSSDSSNVNTWQMKFCNDKEHINSFNLYNGLGHKLYMQYPEKALSLSSEVSDPGSELMAKCGVNQMLYFQTVDMFASKIAGEDWWNNKANSEQKASIMKAVDNTFKVTLYAPSEYGKTYEIYNDKSGDFSCFPSTTIFNDSDSSYYALEYTPYNHNSGYLQKQFCDSEITSRGFYKPSGDSMLHSSVCYPLFSRDAKITFDAVIIGSDKLSGGPDGENLMFKALFGKPLASANIMKQQGEHQAFNQMSNSNEVYGNIILMSDINDNTVLYTDIGYSSSSITTPESGITKEYLTKQGSQVDHLFRSKVTFSGINSIKDESFYLYMNGDLTTKVDLTLVSANDLKANYTIGSLSLNFGSDGKAAMGEFNGLKGAQFEASYDANVCNGNLPSEIQQQCCHSTTMHEEL